MSLYDKASLVQIPSGTKSGTLYSVLPANGNGDFTFGRASSATRVNKDGLIESVASGVPRLDYPLLDGVVQSCPALLLESSRTNYVPRSEDINTGWSKGNVSITNNDTISPDGSQNAAKITEDTNTTQHVVYDTLTGSVSPSTTCYFSCFIKKGTRRYIQLREGFSNTQANIDTNTFTLADSNNLTDYEIENYGNGWYKISFKFTSNSSGDIQFACYLLNDSQNTSYTGDGTSYVYLWGAMIEQGSYATSYIPTSGSTVTRLTEVSNAAGTVSDFNSVQGVLFADLETVKTSGSRVSLSQAADPFAERVSIDFNTATNIRFFVEASDDNNTFNVAVDTVLKRFKIAVKWNGVNISVFIDGFEAATDTFTGFTADTLDRLQMTAANGIGSIFEGDIYQLMTFNEALTDSELEQITSYRSFGEMAKAQQYTIE